MFCQIPMMSLGIGEVNSVPASKQAWLLEDAEVKKLDKNIEAR
jgi:hypothetical protein